MVRVTFIDHAGAETAIEASPGFTVMEAAKANDISGIEAVCGGNCYCGTCRVVVDPAWQEAVGPASDFEAPVLEATGDESSGLRCSCQITLSDALDGLVLRLPELQT